jgi:large subunit ribosomal protein L4
MMADVLNLQGQKVDRVELPAAIFEAPIRSDLMHQALVRQWANARLGTHATKGRSEVAGGGRKPWRQKGTGRARQGSIRAPQWVGGGKVHTPRPRDHRQSMPKKMRRAALRSALSVKAAQSRIVVLDRLELSQPKTKDMASALRRLVGESTALILLPVKDETVELSVRNIPTAKTLPAQYVNVRDLLGYEHLVLPLGAIDALRAQLGG